MKLLTKNTDYAARAILKLAQNKEDYISARELSKEIDVPYEYLRKVLRKLIKEGLIDSKEGISGGVKLNRDPDKVKISALIKIFQGEIKLVECLFRKNICSRRESCVLRKNIMDVEKTVVDEFEKLTIGNMLRQMRRSNEKENNKNRRR